MFFCSVLGSRPSVTNIPGSLKNNSAITITSKTSPRPGFHRVIRPSIIGHNKMSRPMIPGQKISDIRNRLGELRSYSAMRPKSPLQGRLLRPNLPGSVSITKITRDPKKSEPDSNESSSTSKMEVNSDEDTQVLDSDEEDDNKQHRPKAASVAEQDKNKGDPKSSSETSEKSSEIVTSNAVSDKESQPEKEPIVLTTDEKLPTEDALENKTIDENSTEKSKLPDMSKTETMDNMRSADAVERKINPLKNYRHQRPGGRPSLESSLSQLERTASVLNKEGMPDFRKNLDDITQSYSPTGEERPGTKTKKRRSPAKPDGTPEPPAAPSGMTHSISSGMSHSVPSGMPHSVPSGMTHSGPSGMTHGVPSGMTHSGSSGMTHNVPSGMTHSVPSGMTHNVPSGMTHNVPSGMTHSVSSLLGPAAPPRVRRAGSAAPEGRTLEAPLAQPSPGMPLSMSHPAMMSGGTASPADTKPTAPPPAPAYPAGNPPPDGAYPQYPGKAAYH